LRRRFRALVRGVLVRVGRRGPLPETEPASEPEQPAVADALAALQRAEVLDGLCRPGATVLALGTGAEELVAALCSRCPGLALAGGNEPADLAVGVGDLSHLSQAEVESRVHRLHELGTRLVYCLEPESPTVRGALARWYWLRDVWVDDRMAGGPKPDPLTGRVPREPGRYRHLIGHARLVPAESPAQGEARMVP
jgi:hypothetical protein